MPGEKGFLSVLVVALVASTAYYLPNATGGSPARSASSTLAQGSASVGGSAAAANGPRREDAISLLTDHFGITTGGGVDDSLESPQVASRLRGLGLPAAQMTLEFLVATVPDPIDSNARWQFDPIYDSIQRAVSARGYSLDRFYIPDWDPTRDPDAGQRTSGGLHERLPGVVLFRRNGNEFLAVLLVFETATAGVHPIALRRDADGRGVVGRLPGHAAGRGRALQRVAVVERHPDPGAGLFGLDTVHRRRDRCRACHLS